MTLSTVSLPSECIYVNDPSLHLSNQPLRANPDCAELSTLHQRYISWLYQLPDEDIYIPLRTYLMIDSMQLIHSMMMHENISSPYPLGYSASYCKQIEYLIKLEMLIASRN